MKDCLYCNEPAILSAGKRFCTNHIHLYEKPIITNYISGLITRGTIDALMMKKFFKWAFDTTEPKLSDLSKMYERLPRGEWNEKKFLKGGSGYDGTQESYVKRCYLMFLKQQTPN